MSKIDLSYDVICGLCQIYFLLLCQPFWFRTCNGSHIASNDCITLLPHRKKELKPFCVVCVSSSSYSPGTPPFPHSWNILAGQLTIVNGCMNVLSHKTWSTVIERAVQIYGLKTFLWRTVTCGPFIAHVVSLTEWRFMSNTIWNCISLPYNLILIHIYNRLNISQKSDIFSDMTKLAWLSTIYWNLQWFDLHTDTHWSKIYGKEEKKNNTSLNEGKKEP